MEADLSKKKGDSEMKKMIVTAIRPLPGQETVKDILLQDSTDQMTIESVNVLDLPLVFAIEMIFNQHLLAQLVPLVLYEERLAQVHQETCVEMI